MRRWGLGGGLELYDVDTMFAVTAKRTVNISQPVLLPHELVHAFWMVGGPHVMQQRFVGDQGERGLHEFWHRVRGEPWMEAHPLAEQIRRSPGTHIPIRLHGDDAPLNRGRSILAVQSRALFLQRADVGMLWRR